MTRLQKSIKEASMQIKTSPLKLEETRINWPKTSKCRICSQNFQPCETVLNDPKDEYKLVHYTCWLDEGRVERGLKPIFT